MCLAQDIKLPGCVTARVGINSIEPGVVYSPQCQSVSERRLDCDCDDQVLSLYSTKQDIGHNLVIQYEDSGVNKTVQLSNVRLQTEQIDKGVSGLVLRFIAGIIIIPFLLLMFIIGFYVVKKRKDDDESD